jgi:O-antigen/teichoic acid export membrane protein
MAVVILEYFRGSIEVADFRAVVPVAGLNLVVLQSLKLLFMPEASRLYARNDTAGLSDIYWQSAIWTTLATFPLFAVCFFLSEPLVTLLFGERYASSQGSMAPSVLALLSLGNYFNAAMGLNTYTLQVYARVRFITAINAIATAAGLCLNLALIPPLGAVGAAIATTASVVLHNLLHHAGLLWKTDIDLLRWSGWKVYLKVLAAVVVLYLVGKLVGPPAVVTAILVAATSLALFRLNRSSLRIEETFPELSRVPLLRGLFSLEGGR